MKYFYDGDRARVVRKPEEGMYLEYTFEGVNKWFKTERESAYEREYWLGEGNTCLLEISEEKALAMVAAWHSDTPDKTEREKEIKKRLAGRESEYFMFMDD